MRDVYNRIAALEKHMGEECPYAILTCADGSTLKVDPCSIMGTMYRRAMLWQFNIHSGRNPLFLIC